MNLSLIFKVPDFLRKGHTFVDAVKSGKQAAIVAALGAVLACLAPFLGGQINAHPLVAFLFSQDGIQAVGAVITGVAAIAYRIGSSANLGIFPARSEPNGELNSAAPPIGTAGRSEPSNELNSQSAAQLDNASGALAADSKPTAEVPSVGSGVQSDGTDPMSAGG